MTIRLGPRLIIFYSGYCGRVFGVMNLGFLVDILFENRMAYDWTG